MLKWHWLMEIENDNTIIDGLKTVERNADAFADVDLGPTNVSTESETQGYNHLKGQKISKKKRSVSPSNLRLTITKISR